MSQNTETIANPDEEAFQNRKRATCSENPSDFLTSHECIYELPSNSDVAVRAVCDHCGEVMGEWDSEKQAVDATGFQAFGECSGCNEGIWVDGRVVRIVDGEIWHNSCYVVEHSGYELVPASEERPFNRNAEKEFNLHRTVSTVINGEEFVWDEWYLPGPRSDHLKSNLPTRYELTPQQLETLRQWATGRNPTGDDSPLGRKHGQLPAAFILRGGRFEFNAFESWICPECAQIIYPKTTDFGVESNSKCDDCGSGKWMTHGAPIHLDIVEELNPLSNRERQVVLLSVVDAHESDKDIAEVLGVEVSTVKKYRERARQKAQDDSELHESLQYFGVMESNA